MIAVRRLHVAALAALALLAVLSPVSAGAATGPKWGLASVANSAAEVGSTVRYGVHIYNAGDEATLPGPCPGAECQSLEISLPAGLEVESLQGLVEAWQCAVVDPQRVSCTRGGSVAATASQVERSFPDFLILTRVKPGAVGTEVAELSVSGGGAGSRTIHDATRIGPDPGFGVDAFDVGVEDEAGGVFTTAAAHPYAQSTQIDFTRGTDAGHGEAWPAGAAKDAIVELAPGLLGNPLVAGTCTAAQLAVMEGPIEATSLCSPDSQVGIAAISYQYGNSPNDFAKLEGPTAVYNMVAPPGTAARFGFVVLGNVIVLDATVRGGGDYGITVGSTNIPQPLALLSSRVEIWGTPGSEVHRKWRACPGIRQPYFGKAPTCAAEGGERAFLRTPTACTAAGEGLVSRLRTDSWQNPGAWQEASSVSHQLPGYPYPPSEQGAPVGLTDCAAVPFTPSASVLPTTTQADSPSGLEVDLSIPQGGLSDPDAIAQSDLKGAEVTLPEGMSVNPSSADGLGACSSAQIGLLGTNFPAPAPIRFTNEAPNCPDNSKIGTVEIETPLLDHPVEAGVYLAAQQDNPFSSLLALYIAGRDAASGTVLKLAGRVSADPQTGRLVTTFDNQPQIPFESLHLELFGGSRAALRTPASCGSYTSEAVLTPWSGNAPVTVPTGFQITQGPGGGPCPNGGFDPKLSAGTANPLAASYSPFSLRLTRGDGTREMTSITAKLPKGLLAKLAGVPYCPDSALAGVSGNEGTGVGQIASPACPAASRVGTVTVGAGAGANPLYVSTGRAYLAGPYRGAPLSLAVVAPAVAGPFDLGSVVVRNALRVDPETAEVTAVSDPLPTILHGIPLDLRDIRVNLDRGDFTLNPTSCDPMSIEATIGGMGGASANLSNRFQVTSCANLRLKPKLKLRLKGGTKRGDYPALRAELKARPGDANVGRVSVALPHSEFLAQNHIRTICTRVQFAANACPKGSVYGKASATSPLLDQPLSGNVYLRSSSNPLPDLVLALRGQIDVDVVGKIDSVRGGIRTTFAQVPDAPVTKVVLQMQGGRKGLLENSRDICRTTNKANVLIDGQNGKTADSRPVLKVAGCKKKSKKGKHHRGNR